MSSKLAARFAFREAMGLLFMGGALFWSAGGLAWWSAWAVLAVTAAWIVATGVVIIRHRPDLLAERLGPRRGAKRWDTILMSIHGILQLAVFVIGGLDRRFGWSIGVPVPVQLLALVVCASGYSLVVWATATNPFFSQIVRIQTERGHTVVSDGPYRFVRHPAYAGSLLTQLAVPLVLGSWWALALGVIDAALMILRTALEDRDLQAELAGYRDYVQKVRDRLVPGIW